jgi:hypothetical protein
MSYVILPPLYATRSSNSNSSYNSNKSEPELELHSDDGGKENENDDDMDLCEQVTEHREQIATLQSLIQHQGSTILQLRKMELEHLRGLHDDCKYDDGEDDDASDRGGDDDSHSSFEFSSPLILRCSLPRDWSETSVMEGQYHDCFTPPARGARRGETVSVTLSPRIKTAHAGSDLHDAIEAIREEASRVDTIMALNQLDTMRQELDTVKRELQNRGAQVRELHTLVSLKDDRLSVLELERDLYKADATRMQMERKNNNPNNKNSGDSNTRYLDRKSSSSSTTSLSSHLQNNNPPGPSVGGMNDSPYSGISKKNIHVILDDISEASSIIRLPAVQPIRSEPIFRPTTRSTSIPTYTEGSTRFIQKAHSLSTSSSQHQRGTGSVEDPSSVSLSHHSGQSRDKSHRRQKPLPQQPRHPDAPPTKEASKACLHFPKPPQFLSRRKKQSSGKKPHEEYPRPQKQQHARPYHRSSQFPPPSSSTSSLSTIKLHGISAKEQADELQRLLRTSLKTADELRKRVAMLNRYYEDLIRRLNTDQENMERDLVEQICAIESSKRRAVEDLERQLCETQAQLAIEKRYMRR